MTDWPHFHWSAGVGGLYGAVGRLRVLGNGFAPTRTHADPHARPSLTGGPPSHGTSAADTKFLAPVRRLQGPLQA